MIRDPRFDILFEPLAIGPVTTRNRFYQVPHCNGGGYRDPSASPILTFTADPVQARAMTRRDIDDLRRWYRNAFRRARQVGFDLICLYGAHGFGIIQHFLSRATNRRTDEYGGSLANRSRLMRELIEDARDEVGETCAVTVRLSLDELLGEHGFSNAELRDVIEMNAEVPDLWDLAHGAREDCSTTSRFQAEGAQEDLISGIRSLTSKPVVGVGRFTSPDAMVRQIRSGVLDLIGAARPSIADPYLPRKIDEGRVEDIRECIGCNICVSGDMTMSLSRCTQNPTFMEEWRKGWHPEAMQAKGTSDSVLVIGAGPAGLEAARALGLRGYQVALAEAGRQLGGRVSRESQLPGLSAWARVREYREGQLRKMDNVDLYLDSALDAEQVLEFGFHNVAIATGASWRCDAVARHHLYPIPTHADMPLFTPDDLMDGRLPSGEVVLYDDDHFYIGGVLAELLVAKGCRVSLVTPSAYVSEWTLNTLEQGFIQKRLIELGVDIHVTHAVTRIEADHVHMACTYSSREKELAADAVVLVTSRVSNDTLWVALRDREPDWGRAGIRCIKVIGDAQAPAPIAWATYAGHRFARELDEPQMGDAVPFRREVAGLSRR